MNRTVIHLTVLFLLMTIPGALIASVFNHLISIPYGFSIVTAVNSISSSFHAYYVVFFYCLNRKFAQKLRSMLNFSNSRDGDPVTV